MQRGREKGRDGTGEEGWPRMKNSGDTGEDGLGHVRGSEGQICTTDQQQRTISGTDLSHNSVGSELSHLQGLLHILHLRAKQMCYFYGINSCCNKILLQKLLVECASGSMPAPTGRIGPIFCELQTLPMHFSIGASGKRRGRTFSFCHPCWSWYHDYSHSKFSAQM
jgi:hypothetical protein